MFEDFVVGSYSARSREYRGEAFTVVGSNAESGGPVLVHSRIDMPTSEDVRVD